MLCPINLFVYKIEHCLLFINLLVLLFDLEDLVGLGSLDHLVGLQHMLRMLDLVSPEDL